MINLLETRTPDPPDLMPLTWIFDYLRQPLANLVNKSFIKLEKHTMTHTQYTDIYLGNPDWEN